MRERKYEINRYALYDDQGIEEHLSTMAAKGWIIEHMNQLIWWYRRIEPQELEFAVTYDLEMNLYEPIPSKRQIRLQEISELGGWGFVTDWTMMLVFCRPKDEEGIPFQTDPEVTLKLFRDMGIRDLTLGVVLFGIWTLFAMTYSKYESMGFSPTLLLLFWGLVLFTTGVLLSELWFWLWYRRSRISVDHGGECVPAGKAYRISRGMVVLAAMIGLGYWIAAYASLGHLAIGSFYIIAMIVMIFAEGAVRNRNRRRGTSGKTNYWIVFVMGFLIYHLIRMCAKWWLMPYAIEHGWF
ncbi:MAG: DUF2812 domain-containing protein [Firmicutes bacterium]|nr:DUF2812 domain-containing protein [Bacillota bacterium]